MGLMKFNIGTIRINVLPVYKVTSLCKQFN